MCHARHARAQVGRGARRPRPARHRRPDGHQDVQRRRRLRNRAGHAVHRERPAHVERVHQPRGGQQPVHRRHCRRPRPQRGPAGDEEPHVLPQQRHHPRCRQAGHALRRAVRRGRPGDGAAGHGAAPHLLLQKRRAAGRGRRAARSAARLAGRATAHCLHACVPDASDAATCMRWMLLQAAHAVAVRDADMRAPASPPPPTCRGGVAVCVAGQHHGQHHAAQQHDVPGPGTQPQVEQHQVLPLDPDQRGQHRRQPQAARAV